MTQFQKRSIPRSLNRVSPSAAGPLQAPPAARQHTLAEVFAYYETEHLASALMAFVLVMPREEKPDDPR